MSDLESIVGRAVFEATSDKLTVQQRSAIVRKVVQDLRENAQIVRMEMEHEVWGTVR